MKGAQVKISESAYRQRCADMLTIDEFGLLVSHLGGRNAHLRVAKHVPHDMAMCEPHGSGVFNHRLCTQSTTIKLVTKPLPGHP